MDVDNKVFGLEPVFVIEIYRINVFGSRNEFGKSSSSSLISPLS